jgi:hypothetical protein
LKEVSILLWVLPAAELTGAGKDLSDYVFVMASHFSFT